MRDIASILQSLASLGWVAFAFVVLFVFRPDISQLSRRLRKGKFFGQEVELDQELERLEASRDAAVKEVSALPPEERRIVSAAEDERVDAIVKSIVQQAAVDPKVALMSLGTELEREARRTLAVRGLLFGRPNVSVGEALTDLNRQFGLPPNVVGAVQRFDEVRNKIVHGSASTGEDALRALDSGIRILHTLNALRKTSNVVLQPGVELFTDPNCTDRILDTEGLIFETTQSDGTKTWQIVPKTRLNYYKKGEQISWEWGDQRTWPATWYRDPDTGDIRQVPSFPEFVGRHLGDV